VDFSLLMSGVALPWAVLVGWGLATRACRQKPTEALRGRALMVFAAAAGLGLAALHATSEVVERASASSPVPVVRYSGAFRALELAPWRVEPQFLLASAALESGDPTLLDRAWEEMGSKRWLRPRSAALAERRARIALARGDVSVAVSELWEAVEMGGPGEDREELLGGLIRELQDDHGAAEN